MSQSTDIKMKMKMEKITLQYHACNHLLFEIERNVLVTNLNRKRFQIYKYKNKNINI